MKRRGFLGSLIAAMASPALPALPEVASAVPAATNQFRVSHSAGAVNYLDLSAAGSDSNIDIGWMPKGSGGVSFVSSR